MTQQSDSQVRVGPQWRVVIPSRIRKTLGLRPGDTLAARVEDGRLVLEKQEQILRRLKARYAAVPPEVSLAKELIAQRRIEAQRETEQ